METVTPFGFSDDSADENNKPEDFNAMMRQMQEQIQEQLEKLGVNPAGFINPLAAFGGGESEPLPHNVVRDVSRKFITAHGSQPIGVKDVTVVDSALEIADIGVIINLGEVVASGKASELINDPALRAAYLGY